MTKRPNPRHAVDAWNSRLEAGEVSDEFDAEVSTSGAIAGFNSNYMTDALAALDGDGIDVEFSPNSPILLRNTADRDGQLQLVMAMWV
ncbi:MAG: hypothetical protein LCH93_13615 [Proteobacteria bacterium]|nr:hypothetical protein [Pseudomonadota bacterium]